MVDVTVGFVGMTHLAINALAATAARGFHVVGYDADVELIDALGEGRLPFVEPDLPALLRDHRNRIRFHDEPGSLAHCDVVYVAPDVATDDRGISDLDLLCELLRIADTRMRADAVLVVLSQVPSGFTRQVPRAKATLYYQVETLIFGRAVERAMHPERIIVGCDDPARPLPPAYAAVLQAFDCPILPMRYESAELCKAAINMFLVASVTTTNVIAELCERIGADWSEIAPALRLDRRIGPHAYLDPGLGISGGNLERDLATFCRLADRNGTDAAMVRAWTANSSYRKDWPLRMLRRHLLADRAAPTLGILGLSYKENTSSVKNAPALRLIDALPNVTMRAYDPAVPEASVARPGLVRVGSALDAADGADGLAIMTPWPAFRDLDPAAIAACMRGQLVVDPYGVLDPKGCAAAGLRQVVLGRQPDDEQPDEEV